MSRSVSLLSWYDRVQRDLPWRRTTDPYRILVSEVMLQQTQAGRVVPFYERFLDAYPTVESVAAADLRDLLTLWKGLGYPARVRRLRDAARVVVAEGWPTSARELQSLPGVGPYTAAAVASFAFGEDVALVDTNVKRVVSRWRGRPLKGADLEAAAAEELAAPAHRWNQAMMELGALLCLPRQPRCDDCPVQTWCTDPTIYEPPPRQPSYRGSVRQERGRILGLLLEAGDTRLDAIVDASPMERDRASEVVSALEADRLVRVSGGVVSLAE